MDFEIIDPVLLKSKSYPVSISLATYGMVLSTGAYDNLGKPTHILFGYDKKQSLLSLQGVKDDDGRSVKCAVKKGCARINNSAITHYISTLTGIEFTEKGKKFEAIWDEQKKMLVADLNKEPLLND